MNLWRTGKKGQKVKQFCSEKTLNVIQMTKKDEPAMTYNSI